MHPHAPNSFFLAVSMAAYINHTLTLSTNCEYVLAADLTVCSTDPGTDPPSSKAQIAKQLQSVDARQQSGREDLRAALVNFMCRTSRRGAAAPTSSDENGNAESAIASRGRSGKSRAGVCADERMRCCAPSFDFG